MDGRGLVENKKKVPIFGTEGGTAQGAWSLHIKAPEQKTRSVFYSNSLFPGPVRGNGLCGGSG